MTLAFDVIGRSHGPVHYATLKGLDSDCGTSIVSHDQASSIEEYSETTHH